MRTIWLYGDQYIRWEPSTDLICARCRQPLDIKTLYRPSLECVNFVWPDDEALAAGEYIYLHKRCCDFPENFLMLDMKTVLGKDKFPGSHGGPAFMKTQMPKEAWETLRSQWLPSSTTRKKPQQVTALRALSGWLSLRFLILKRDNYRCRLCGVTAADGPDVRLEVDHITPRSKGGTDDPSNLWTLCFPCNRGKRNRFL